MSAKKMLNFHTAMNVSLVLLAFLIAILVLNFMLETSAKNVLPAITDTQIAKVGNKYRQIMVLYSLHSMCTLLVTENRLKKLKIKTSHMANAGTDISPVVKICSHEGICCTIQDFGGRCPGQKGSER